ncbi:MAG: secondary thiamine-phosphate synthase enzyme YjbQ [bacterium]|nr:secondary thiamine-phosphate synthase enzyme YjbQ [bacterium]
MQTINISTTKNKEIIDLTDRINSLLSKGAKLCHLFVKHTTCAVTTADLDPGTDKDMLEAFWEMIPKLNYRHPHNPAHVPAHIASSIIGPDVTIPIKDGELDLGTWQRVILVELDGPREREIIINFS